MIVTIRRPNRGIVLHVKRVGLDPSLLIVESDSLLYEVPLKPASLELEVRVQERASLVASGRFRLDLPEDSTLLVRTSEHRVEIEAADGSRKFAVLDGMAWIEAI
jgi:hypothetical protein